MKPSSCALALAVGGIAMLASAWAEDGYLLSNGTQSLNLGYYMNGKTRIEVDFQYPEKPTDMILFGAWNDSAKLCSGFGNDGGVYCFILNDNKYANTRTTVACDTGRHTAIIDAAADGVLTLKTGAATTWTGTIGSQTCKNTAVWPVVLFGAANSAKGDSKQRVSAKVFGVKIYEDGELVYNYVPAKKGDRTGLWDADKGRFIGSTLALEMGGDFETLVDDGYVEATNADNLINTGYYFNSKSRVEVDYAQTEVRTGPILFGAWDAKNGCNMGTALWDNNSGNLQFITGDEIKFSTQFWTADTDRHTAIIDAPNGSVSFKTGDFLNFTEKPATTFEKDSGLPFTLGGAATSAAGLTGNMYARIRIYGVKIYEDGVMVHDFIPTKQGKLVGLRDSVTGLYVRDDRIGGRALVAGGGIITREDPYIESRAEDNTGLNTSYHMKGGISRVELDYLTTGTYTYSGRFIFGTYNQEAEGLRALAWYSNNTVNYVLNDKTHKNYDSGVSANTYRHKLVLDTASPDKQMVYITGATTNWYGKIADGCTLNNTSTCPMALCAGMNAANGSAYANPCGIRVYGFKIYENNELVHDYLPSMKNGRAGLYDTLSGAAIYANDNFNIGGDWDFSGTGEPEDAYVESDGKLLLNTGYHLKQNSRVETDFRLLNLAGSQVVCGAWGNGASIRWCMWSNGGRYTTMLGGNNRTPQNSFDTMYLNQDRHRGLLDVKNLMYGVTTETAAGSVTNHWAKLADPAFKSADEYCMHPMGVFGSIHNADATVTNMPCKARVYSVRIWEDDILKHEFLPWTDGSDVGLYDVVTGAKALRHSTGVAQPKLGGRGVEGKRSYFAIKPQDVTLTKDGGAKTLRAFAPGAIRYVWIKDGKVVKGVTGGELSVEWTRRPRESVVSVKPVYFVDGVETLGEAVNAKVTNRPNGLMIIFH